MVTSSLREIRSLLEIWVSDEGNLVASHSGGENLVAFQERAALEQTSPRNLTFEDLKGDIEPT